MTHKQPLPGSSARQAPLQQSVQKLGRGSTPLRMQHPRPALQSQRPTLQFNPGAREHVMQTSPPVPQASYSPITHVPNAQQPVAQLPLAQAQAPS
jgi:hypothetical protein